MVLSHRNPCRDSDGSDDEGEPWELIGDEVARALLPGGGERELSLEADAPQDGHGSVASGVSSLTHPSIAGAEIDAGHGAGDALGREQDIAPETLPGRDVEGNTIEDDSREPESLLAPNPSVAEKSISPAAAAEPTGASAPSTESAGNNGGETFESSGLVASLSGMGFAKEQVENAIGRLREAGSDVGADSVIGEMAGERKDGGRAGDAVQASAPALGAPIAEAEPPKNETEDVRSEGSNLVDSLSSMGFRKEHIEEAIDDLRGAGSEVDADSVIGRMTSETHGLERTQNLADVGRLARELLSVARDEARRRRATLRDDCARARVRARVAATEARYAAASARDAVCRAEEERGIAAKAAAAAVAGGVALLALGKVRAGLGAVAVAGSCVVAGEAMRQAAARSTSTRTTDYGLREGVHLD